MDKTPPLIQWRRLCIRFAVYCLAFVALASAYWVGRTFGNPSIHQLLYHLEFIESLLKDSDSVFQQAFVVQCIVFPLLAATALTSFEIYLKRRWAARMQKDPRPSFVTTGKRFGVWVGRHFPAVAVATSILAIVMQFSLVSVALSNFGPDHFAARYVDPSTIATSKNALKNLVLIYVESLENAYGDPTVFGSDLLSELHALPGISFDAYETAPGAAWTIGGIVATQCGIPLKRSAMLGGFENNDALAAFLANATCLPDILDRHGYRNVFLGGAQLSFAGKGFFLKSHHYHEAYGLSEWLALKDPTLFEEISPWGIYDDALFRAAAQKLDELHRTAQPFNLTILTLDMHHPQGHYSKYCRARGAARFEDLVQCASQMVSTFVRHIEQSGYLQDTNVVILGDHLAQPNPVYEKLLAYPRRTIFNKFISLNPPQKHFDNIIPFDLFPTLLEFAGVNVAGGRLGLGYSAFFNANSAAPPPSASRIEASPVIMNPSSAYERLWSAQ